MEGTNLTIIDWGTNMTDTSVGSQGQGTLTEGLWTLSGLGFQDQLWRLAAAMGTNTSDEREI